MDDYQKSLLVTLDRNLVKMILPPATFDDDGDDRNAIIALQRALLGLHLQAFIPLAGRFVDSPVLPVDGSQRLRQTVEDVLSLLDSLTDSKYVPKLPKVSDIYPSLGKTLSDLQHLSAIDMVGSSKSSLFVVDSIGVADQACKTLTRANDVLQHIKHEYFEKPPKIGHAKDTGDEDDEYCRHIRVLEREYQYALGRVLDTLKHNFGTCHPEELHEVLVELAPAIDADSSSVPEDKFDTYIYCPKLRRKTAVRCNIHK